MLPNRIYNESLRTELLGIIEELIVVLDTEFDLMQDDSAKTDDLLKAVVHEKQILSNEYARFCAMFKELPQPTKENLGTYARENRELFETFSEKLRRNLDVIEARYARSEARVQACLNAIREDENKSQTYNDTAQIKNNVLPFPAGLSS